MWPYTPDYEDDKAFAVFQRTAGLVRASMNAGDEGVRSRTFGQDEQSELDSHIAFVDGKRLCVIFLVDNEGGELDLFPNPTGYDYNEVTLPLTKGKIVVFRCDALGLNYSYRPKGKNLAVLSWVLDIPSTWKEKEEALRIIDGPAEPEGKRNNIMGVHTRYPGLGFQVQVKVPLQRWDTEIYYRHSNVGAEHTIGFSMTCHGATLQQSEIELFDNQFFGIDKKEAMEMAPYMRCMLEVGYEALHNAGHRKNELKNFKCGVFVGDSGASGSNFRQKLEDQMNPNIATDLKHGLVIGCNTLIGPYGYISLSGPGMLTHQGRCFTFDHSADGFARGEGYPVYFESELIDYGTNARADVWGHATKGHRYSITGPLESLAAFR
eukprot:Skav215718  [mRNA]  locus=scaffold2573:548558:565726:- [translate_table: standard]